MRPYQQSTGSNIKLESQNKKMRQLRLRKKGAAKSISNNQVAQIASSGEFKELKS